MLTAEVQAPSPAIIEKLLDAAMKEQAKTFKQEMDKALRKFATQFRKELCQDLSQMSPRVEDVVARRRDPKDYANGGRARREPNEYGSDGTGSNEPGTVSRRTTVDVQLLQISKRNFHANQEALDKVKQAADKKAKQDAMADKAKTMFQKVRSRSHLGDFPDTPTRQGTKETIQEDYRTLTILTDTETAQNSQLLLGTDDGGFAPVSPKRAAEELETDMKEAEDFDSGTIDSGTKMVTWDEQEITNNTRRRHSLDLWQGKVVGQLSAYSALAGQAAEIPWSAWVEHPCVESTVGCLVLANALLLGLEADYQVTNTSSEHQHYPALFNYTELAFAIFFLLELTFRMAVYQLRFFTMKGAMWNIFDLVVVGMQVTDLTVHYLLEYSQRFNMSFLRLLRILRVMRVTRAVKYIEELRVLARSIVGGLRATFWTLLFIFLLVYATALLIVHIILASDHDPAAVLHSPDLDAWYGSLGRTMLTLYESIAHGMPWGDALAPLMEISPFVSFIFSIYISFSVFAMLNVVTGLFVERALQHAKLKDKNAQDDLLKVFVDSDESNSGQIKWREFAKNLGTDEMREYFKSIEVDISEAEYIFKLLDADGSGTIDTIEFVSGCMRLRGPAKALELKLLNHVMNLFSDWTIEHVSLLEEDVAWIVQNMKDQQANRTKVTSEE